LDWIKEDVKMEFKLSEVAERLRELRDILEIPLSEMAAVTGVTEEQYRAIEAGENDFSFTFLYKCAQRLGVDMTDLLTGEGPRLEGCSLIRSGEGMPIERREGFSYFNLAYLFKHRQAEPFLVTAPYREEEQDRPIALSSHDTQEMDYILSGQLKFTYNGRIEVLRPGDTVYYDARKPHGMIAVGGEPCKFLAIVIRDDGERR